MEDAEKESGTADNVAGFYITNSISGRYNPPGSSIDTLVYYRIPFHKIDTQFPGKRGTDSVDLWNRNHLDTGISNQISFASERLSAYIQVEPIIFFDVTFKGGFEWDYNAFDYGVPRLPASDSPIDENSLNSYVRGESDFALYMNIRPRLKFKFGPILLMNRFYYYYYEYRTVTSGTIYNITLDTPMETTDSVLLNSTCLFWEITENFMLGLDYDYLYTVSNGYSYDRLSLIGNYSRDLPRKTKFSLTAMLGYFFHHDRFDYFLALQADLSHKL